jgi:hypothetical protein
VLYRAPLLLAALAGLAFCGAACSSLTKPDEVAIGPEPPPPPRAAPARVEPLHPAPAPPGAAQRAVPVGGPPAAAPPSGGNCGN